MLECNHLRPDKTESADDSKQCRFVTKWSCWLNDFVQNTDKENSQNIENIFTYYLDADLQFTTQSTMDNIVGNLTSVFVRFSSENKPSSNSEYKQ